MLLQVQLVTISGVTRKTSIKKCEPAWSLYILQCRDHTFYTGITTDLKRRLTQHNDGIASRYTRSRIPVVMVYNETCDDHRAALKREYTVKQLSREEKKQLVKSKNKKTAAVQKKRAKALRSRERLSGQGMP